MLFNWLESLVVLVEGTGQLKLARNVTSVKHRHAALAQRGKAAHRFT